MTTQPIANIIDSVVYCTTYRYRQIEILNNYDRGSGSGGSTDTGIEEEEDTFQDNEKLLDVHAYHDFAVR